jgi:hypothetical protein
MMTSRRSILSAIAFGLPFGLGARLRACAPPLAAVPTLRFRLFEEEVLAAFADNGPFSQVAARRCYAAVSKSAIANRYKPAYRVVTTTAHLPVFQPDTCGS